MIEAYFIHLLILIGIYIILALSLQLAIGYTGLLNLGHIAFFGIGAYTSALLTLNGIGFVWAFLIAGIIAMLFGFLISIPVNRLKGDYLALATMGFSFVVFAFLLNWTSLTRGPLGIANIPSPSFFGLQINSTWIFLLFVVIIAVITFLIIYKIISSPFGKVLEAIRDDELGAKVMGKNTIKMKSYAFAISAFFAGIAGSLYAHYITYISPSAFTVMQLIPILAIVIIGGLASLKGTVIATIILVLLPEPLRFIGIDSALVGPLRQLIYATILLIILIYRPKGLFGKIEL
ncbi:MAG: branched-chain amino acid ABC transporter permease [Nanoarchaeota archaeon]